MSEPKKQHTNNPEQEPSDEQAGEQQAPNARPPLGRITSITRPGVEMFIPNGMPIYEWVFMALPHFGGLIIPKDPIILDPRIWHALTEWGMPTDMKVIDVVYSTAGYDLKFDNFAIAARLQVF